MSEQRPYSREDLLRFLPDSCRQADAWDRLRQVCIDLGVPIPTMRDVRNMEKKWDGVARDFMERHAPDGEFFVEELSSFVIVRLKAGLDEESQRLRVAYVNFNAGYLLE